MSIKFRIRIFTFILIFMSFKIINSAVSSTAQAEWTVLVYMEADNNLSMFAQHNLRDMLSANSSEKSNLLVQCNQYHNQGIWRYRITKNNLEVDSTLPAPEIGKHDCVSELVSSVRWASERYPAKKYALILWDHGVGIIDPLWGAANPWLAKYQEMFAGNPRVNIPGFEVDSKDCLENELHRGILFNETARTYMNNQQLSDALGQINKILNKKIDLVGMDACLMAMVEVGYQIKNHADILVASQEVELAEGWRYSPFISLLAGGNVGSFDLAQSIVLSYDAYYKNKSAIYTQSAIDLTHMDNLRKSIDGIVSLIIKCHKQHNAIKQMIYNARNSCLQFNTSSYIDLHSFYAELYNQLKNGNLRNDLCESALEDRKSNLDLVHTVLPENYYQENVVRSDAMDLAINNESEAEQLKHMQPNLILPKPPISREIEDLKNALVFGMKVIETSVISSLSGKNLSKAKGMSIYFPYKPSRIDISYLRTDFAKDSLWIEFLKNYL